MLYFLAIYPIVLIYGVSITNTVDSLLVNQLGMASPPRAVLSFLLIAVMMAVKVAGQRVMLLVTGWLVYPLILILFGTSLYLIPSWDLGALTAGATAGVGEVLMSLWLVIPVLVFAFNHSPAISRFSLAMQRQYGQAAATRASAVLAHVHDSPLIFALGPIVAILAIVSSFFGHCLGTAAFIFVTTWLVAIANPGVLALIETVAGPVIAIILYVMPMYAIRRLPALAAYRGALSNVFVTLAGLVAVSGIVYEVARTVTGA